MDEDRRQGLLDLFRFTVFRQTKLASRESVISTRAPLYMLLGFLTSGSIQTRSSPVFITPFELVLREIGRRNLHLQISPAN